MKPYTPSNATIASLLSLLARGRHARYNKTTCQLKVSEAHIDRVYRFKPETLQWLQQQGLLLLNADGRVSLAKSAASWMRRNASVPETRGSFRAQHDSVKQMEITDPAGLSQRVMAVDPESPLAWLMARKDKSGVPFLNNAHYKAGEKLRQDYGRAALNPQMGMNWSPSSVSNKTTNRATGDANDASLDARDRVNVALSAVGPELAGPLLDVCCNLRSLSDVEKSRGWPARSGKLILKLSLESLARHYGLLREASGPQFSSGIRHTGTSDYRPSI